jgi:hypothetical protein
LLLLLFMFMFQQPRWCGKSQLSKLNSMPR